MRTRPIVLRPPSSEPQLDAPALREIAAEAWISRLAVDQAIQEHKSTALTWVSWLKRHRTLVTIAPIVGALLVLILSARPHLTSIGS